VKSICTALVKVNWKTFPPPASDRMGFCEGTNQI
jgi:hypothetical protein